MSLSSGTRIGPYEILGTLGAGGMGEVYRARDTRLNRTVAVKAMHELFAQHPERVARFEREAQLLASLNHPNIAAIHGVEESQGSTFLVLEFVDGRPLSEILQAGAPLLAEALTIANQIAGALAAAHERGIIHRDLKPGNVMVTADGQVKVLDFGLGKALESESSRAADPSSAHAQSPTMTMAATQAGIILGTAGYMSPEQAKGRGADKRSDVWAFGCVLFELVAGKRAFDGEDVTEILAAIVRGEPDWDALPASLPGSLRDLIKRCLVRNRADRLADMSVVQFVLNERGSTTSAHVVPPTATLRTSTRSISLPIVIALTLVAAVVTASLVWLLFRGTASSSPASSPVHLAITLPDGDEVSFLNQTPVAISPDGTTVAYTAVHDGKLLLFVRKLADSESRELPGTDGAKSPFFSPSGEWIAFFAQGAGKLRKITVGGTAMQDLADAPDARGGAWSADDVIYFAPTNVSNVMKVSAAGNSPASPATELDRSKGDISHRWPKVLPGNKSLLMSVWTGPGPDECQIVEWPLGSERRQVLKGGQEPTYISPGYLLYGRLDGLFAMPWRPGQRDLGQTVPITLKESARLDNEGSSDYAVSNDGTLVYIPGSPARLAQRIVWADRHGKIETLPLPEREFESVAISPDGKQAAVQIQDSVVGIWLYDFERHGLTPLAKGDGSSQAALWSKDGKSIIYRGTRLGYRNVFRRNADGSGAEERLTKKENVIQTPTSVTPDGEWALFNEAGGAGSKGAIWRVRLDGDHTVEAILQNGELNGQISPDGKWMAFQTTQDRQSEVYVQPYPGPGARHQVSIGGGAWPLWSLDGNELYYESADELMAVDIKTGGGFVAGAPHAIVNGRFRTSINGNTPYSVARDGRFLRIQRVQPDRPVTQIDVVLNWFEKLRAAQK